VSRRRRALLLLGLALLLGGLAAADVSRHEAAATERLGPLTDVVVARTALPAGRRLGLDDLALRSIPGRYAPPGARPFAGALVGHRLAVPVAKGATVTAALLQAPPARSDAGIEPGQRAIDLVATGSPAAVVKGARVDVVVTSERSEAAAGAARIALEDVEVLAARAARADELKDGRTVGPHVSATLRVTPAQAVYLAAAQSFAGDVRLLARAAGDDRHVGALRVSEAL